VLRSLLIDAKLLRTLVAGIFVFLNMHALNQPEVMIGNAAEQFDTRGNLKDEAAKDLIRHLLRNLVSWTRRLQN
jgi:chromate reductase